jgi:hypothetical protein
MSGRSYLPPDGLYGQTLDFAGRMEIAGKAPTAHEPNWPILYTAVLAELVILIVAFYAFTKALA